MFYSHLWVTTRLQGLQITVQETRFEKMVRVATKIPRMALTLLIEILLLPPLLGLILLAVCKPNFNPKDKDVKKGKPPILLLHGSGFNQSEWLLGRLFLKSQQFGSVFSLNYAGLLSNEPSKGIEDYAKEKIRQEVKRIKELTGRDDVIIIGHSMGGLIGGYYAEYLAKEDGVNVDVISIASPWKGTPMIDAFWKLGGPYSYEKEAKRYQQMSVCGSTKTDPGFRQRLVSKALHSERTGLRKYFSIWSSTDYAVPKLSGTLSEDPRRQRSYSYLGHNMLVAWPSVWLQVRSWLKMLYTEKQRISLVAKPKNSVKQLKVQSANSLTLGNPKLA